MSLTNPTFSGSPQGRPATRTRRRTRTVEPVPYDFKRPVQLSREHQRILQLGFDAFARQAMTVFTSALRSVCHVEVTKIDQRTYHEYVDSLGATTYMTMWTAEPMPGVGVLEIPLNAVMSCIDHMLGGPGTGRQPERPLTEIESGVIRGVVARLLSEMRYSLADIVAIDPMAASVEYSPQFAQAAGPADIVVVVRLELRIGERPYEMTVCLPFNGLLPHLQAAATPSAVSNRERAERDRAAGLLQGRFQTVPVDVAVRFRSTVLDPAALTALKPGDVLRLAHPASAPLDVTVDDTAFAHATAGAQGPRLAALIIATPEESK